MINANQATRVAERQLEEALNVDENTDRERATHALVGLGYAVLALVDVASRLDVRPWGDAK